LKKVGIIGAGKIGGSLLLRLAESGGFDLGASDIHPEQLRPYESVGVRTTSSNRELAEASDLVIAAVKPWDVAQVMEEISPSFRDNSKAVTSVAAGVSIERISESLPQGTAILRVMPNVCASVGLGSAVVTSNEAGRAALPTVMDIFRHVGEVLELPERLFDAATALHGSGPAYVARRLVIGTIGGTAVLLKERSAHQVRDEVMTPGGTTAAAFVAMEKAGFVAAVYDGVEAATERARRLG
jgi:pyrroline-5-carboxylate reductase